MKNIEKKQRLPPQCERPLTYTTGRSEVNVRSQKANPQAKPIELVRHSSVLHSVRVQPNYRPQPSYEKVMFSVACVRLSVRWGVPLCRFLSKLLENERNCTEGDAHP